MVQNDGEMRPTGEVTARKVSAGELQEARREARTMAHGATWITVRYDGNDLRVSIVGSRTYASGRTATAAVDITEGTEALVKALDKLMDANQDAVEEATFDAAVESRMVAKTRGEL